MIGQQRAYKPQHRAREKLPAHSKALVGIQLICYVGLFIHLYYFSPLTILVSAIGIVSIGGVRFLINETDVDAMPLIEKI